MEEKNANIEVLRMASMLLILMHHAVLYSDILSTNIVTFNKYLASIIYIGGKYGANVFFAITAYLLIDKPFHIRRIIKVWETTFFYGVIMFVLNLFIGFRSFEIKDICETIFPICYKSYWFVTAYIGLILLSPFLNLLINALNKETYMILLVFIVCMMSLPVTFLPGAHPYSDESHLMLCIFIYLFIGYYKKGFADKWIKKWRGVAVGGFLCMILSAVVIITINNSILNNYITYWMSGESFPMLMFSIGSSIYVFNKPLKTSSFIEKISRGIFDIYLIHMNHFVYLWLWNEMFKIEQYYNTRLFIIKLLGISLLVFLVCLIIGNIRAVISNYIHSRVKSYNLEKMCKKIDLKLQL